MIPPRRVRRLTSAGPIPDVLGLLLFVLTYFDAPAAAWTSTSHRTRSTTLRSHPPSPASMSTCLAVVPPDEAWDRLQRARHIARDKTYSKWPPAIRLFHPFSLDMALRIAELVEENKIEPFEVKLDQWNIIPHVEAMEADWEAMQGVPEADANVNQQDKFWTKEERQVQELIAREEQIGREKLEERQRRSDDDSKNNDRPVQVDSKKMLLQKQKRMYEEFNGPAVICLSPDAASQEKLESLRSLLLQGFTKEEAALYKKISPSSSVSDTGRLPKADQAFRPLVPIAAFPTVTSAIEMARKLRELWKPLSFPVTDLHLISSSSTASQPDDTASPGGIDPSFLNNREYQLFHQHSERSRLAHPGGDEERHLTTDGKFGCDALIMLMGQEMEMDEELNEKMANLVFEQGTPGGYQAKHETEENPSDYAEDEGDLEQWLHQDDDFDEGTVVVIGRTHFFTGDMRQYLGMPAFSVMDGKDRVLGDSVSGAARRRGAVHRSSDKLNEQGNWGRNDEDYLPRTNKQKARQNRSRFEASQQQQQRDEPDDA
jgi:hypothetical protein